MKEGGGRGRKGESRAENFKKDNNNKKVNWIPSKLFPFSAGRTHNGE
jgi:hypothetical protein